MHVKGSHPILWDKNDKLAAPGHRGRAQTSAKRFMRRVVVFGPGTPIGALSGARFARLLSERLGVHAEILEPLPAMAVATASADTSLLWDQLTGSPAQTNAAAADTLVWLRYTPRAYLRDWIAGWLDRWMNGTPRGGRARLTEVACAAARLLCRAPLDARQIDNLRPRVRLVELHSPEQALFWLRMQEHRLRETRLQYAYW